MNRNKIAFVGSLVVVAVAGHIHGRIHQHQKHLQNMDELHDELTILFRAYMRLRERVNTGQFRDPNPERINEELQFEIIAAREE